MKLNKKGYSLVELVIVVAIMAVVASMMIFGAGALTGYKAKQAAEKLVSYMDDAKTNSMAFDSVNLKLYLKNNKYYCDVSRYKYTFDAHGAKTLTEDKVESYELGGNQISIEVKMVADEEVVYNILNRSVTISFDSSSGAFNKAVVSEAETPIDSSRYIDEIIIKQGSGAGAKTFKIKCIRLTGKFYLE